MKRLYYYYDDDLEFSNFYVWTNHGKWWFIRRVLCSYGEERTEKKISLFLCCYQSVDWFGMSLKSQSQNVKPSSLTTVLSLNTSYHPLSVSYIPTVPFFCGYPQPFLLSVHLICIPSLFLTCSAHLNLQLFTWTIIPRFLYISFNSLFILILQHSLSIICPKIFFITLFSNTICLFSVPLVIANVSYPYSSSWLW